MNSFMLLGKEQQLALRPIQYFFEIKRPISMSTLDHTATHLAAACRLKDIPELVIRESRGKVVPRFITAKSLPHVLAQTIADMGLSQMVLRRSLVLVGCVPVKPEKEGAVSSSSSRSSSPRHDESDEECKSIPPLSANHVSRLEDVAALIVIACLMDPMWRERHYCRTRRRFQSRDRMIPVGDEHLHWMGNGSATESYVDFLEEIILCEDDSYVPSFVELLRKNDAPAAMNPEKLKSNAGGDGKGSMTAPIRPCPSMAGVSMKGSLDATLVNTSVDPQKRMLMEFVAHCIGVQPFQVETSFHKFLS